MGPKVANFYEEMRCKSWQVCVENFDEFATNVYETSCSYSIQQGKFIYWGVFLFIWKARKNVDIVWHLLVRSVTANQLGAYKPNAW